jgi:hypothetical protein
MIAMHTIVSVQVLAHAETEISNINNENDALPDQVSAAPHQSF